MTDRQNDTVAQVRTVLLNALAALEAPAPTVDPGVLQAAPGPARIGLLGLLGVNDSAARCASCGAARADTPRVDERGSTARLGTSKTPRRWRHGGGR
jgi:hypothetical protein